MQVVALATAPLCAENSRPISHGAMCAFSPAVAPQGFHVGASAQSAMERRGEGGEGETNKVCTPNGIRVHVMGDKGDVFFFSVCWSNYIP